MIMKASFALLNFFVLRLAKMQEQLLEYLVALQQGQAEIDKKLEEVQNLQNQTKTSSNGTCTRDQCYDMLFWTLTLDTYFIILLYWHKQYDKYLFCNPVLYEDVVRNRFYVEFQLAF